MHIAHERYFTRSLPAILAKHLAVTEINNATRSDFERSMTATFGYYLRWLFAIQNEKQKSNDFSKTWEKSHADDLRSAVKLNVVRHIVKPCHFVYGHSVQFTFRTSVDLRVSLQDCHENRTV